MTSDIILELTKSYNPTISVYRIHPYDKYEQMLKIKGNGFIKHGLMAEFLLNNKTAINIPNLLHCYTTINEIYSDEEPLEVLFYTNDENKIKFNIFDKTEYGFKISMWNVGLYNNKMGIHFKMDIIFKNDVEKIKLRVDFSSSLYDNSTCNSEFNHSNCACNEAHNLDYVCVDIFDAYCIRQTSNFMDIYPNKLCTDNKHIHKINEEKKLHNIEQQQTAFTRFVESYGSHMSCISF